MKSSITDKIQHLKIDMPPEQSFSVHHNVVPFFHNKLHCHPELELVYIVKGSGKQFIGDSIHYFKGGDMILVGENLPHLWKNDEQYFSKKADLDCESYIIHFANDCFGKEFFNLPENKNLKELLVKAKQGVSINGNTKSAVIQMMQEILHARSTQRIILLVNILNIIAASKNTKTICTQSVNFNLSSSDSERINAICQYIMQHFNRKIPLKEIAAVAHLTPNSFCRYFKSRIKKSLCDFLIEIRIGHACKLLAETEMPVAEICFECGYNSFSNFNKHFRLITGKSPLQYRKYFQKAA